MCTRAENAKLAISDKEALISYMLYDAVTSQAVRDDIIYEY